MGLLGYPPAEVNRARERIRSLGELEERDPLTQPVDAILCAAGSAWRLVQLLVPLVQPGLLRTAPDNVVRYRAPVVLLDVLGDIGGRVAALHALHGYLTPDRAPEEWLACLKTAASRHRYACGADSQAFYDAWVEGPLTALEHEDLRLAAVGDALRERCASIGMARSTLQNREEDLKRRLEVDPQWRVQATAVSLGFCRHWPGPHTGGEGGES